jgi:transcriptional regulator
MDDQLATSIEQSIARLPIDYSITRLPDYPITQLTRFSHRISMGLDAEGSSMDTSHRNPMGVLNQRPDLLKGTLDLLILRTLQRGPMHGYDIAQQIRVRSEEILQVGEGSLYPALQRLLLNGWVTAEWGASENNRRARYYTLTAAGRKQLTAERQRFDRLITAIRKVVSQK